MSPSRHPIKMAVKDARRDQSWAAVGTIPLRLAWETSLVLAGGGKQPIDNAFKRRREPPEPQPSNWELSCCIMESGSESKSTLTLAVRIPRCTASSILG